MKKIVTRAGFATFLAVALSLMYLKFNSEVAAQSMLNRPAPEFTQTDPAAWLKSPPLTMADLRGEVVLIDFWAFGCWNCYRSFPWLNALEADLAGEDFRVIGIHSPEYEHEKNRTAVLAKVEEFELKHPTMLDNDFGYWRSLHNRYWPAYYLIDRKGIVRHVFIGETHAGTRRAQAVEKAIRALLAEAA